MHCVCSSGDRQGAEWAHRTAQAPPSSAALARRHALHVPARVTCEVDGGRPRVERVQRPRVVERAQGRPERLAHPARLQTPVSQARSSAQINWERLNRVGAPEKAKGYNPIAFALSSSTTSCKTRSSAQMPAWTCAAHLAIGLGAHHAGLVARLCGAAEGVEMATCTVYLRSCSVGSHPPRPITSSLCRREHTRVRAYAYVCARARKNVCGERAGRHAPGTC